MLRRVWLPPLLLLGGCVQVDEIRSDDLLSAPSPVLAGDALYYLIPAAEQVVRLVPGPADVTDAPYSDLSAAEVTVFQFEGTSRALAASPDGQTVVALTHGLTDQLLIFTGDGACVPNEDGSCGAPALEARPLHDQVTFSPDGRWALTWISDGAATETGEAVVNLNEVGIYDLAQREVRFATLGFGPHAFAFTGEGDLAVVLTRSQVAVVDLPTGDVRLRELTLGSDTRVSPNLVGLTGDDHFALVSVEGSSDLFTFDLTQASLPINILGLSGVPAVMAPTQDGQGTLILTSDGYHLDVLHHDDLTVSSETLRVRANALTVPPAGDYAVLWQMYGTSVGIFDVRTERVTDVLLDNPAFDLSVSPDAAVLVIFYAPDGADSADGSPLSQSYAVALLNLAQGDNRPDPVLTSAPPFGVAFVPGVEVGTGTAYTLLEASDGGRVASFDLDTNGSAALLVGPAPRQIGRLASDGRLVVVHDAGLGLVSLIDPATPDQVQMIHGFLAEDLL